MYKKMLVAIGIALVASASFGQKPLPAFVENVQLHNVGGAEATEDGKAVMLYRVPKAVRDQLTEKNKSSNATGADTMRQARHSEIRFVVNDRKALGDVKIHLQAPKNGATATIYWGDIYSSHQRISNASRPKPITVSGHGLMYNVMDKYPRGRFANNVVRIIIEGSEVSMHGIDGDVRPPTADELPPIMMSYGTSISQGYNASRPDLTWTSLTARQIGHDVVNLGSSGTAFCEKAMADYITAQPWDVAVLEISVNMVGNFDTPTFRERATYMVNTLAKSHPDAPIYCISIFPWGVGEYWAGNSARKTIEFRDALKEICESSPHKNVHYVHGPDLLSFSGLYHDMLHPSDVGMIEIATKLAPIIKSHLKPEAK